MKKFIQLSKVVLLVFITSFLMILTSCNEALVTNNLPLPTEVRIVSTEEGAFVFFNEVENADYYYLYLYDESDKLLTKYYLTDADANKGYKLLLDDGQYSIKVSACSSSSTIYPSELTQSIEISIDDNDGNNDEDKDYTIEYVLNGGSIEGSYATSYTKGDTIVLPVPTKSNATFEGWYTSAYFTGSSVSTIIKTEYGDKCFYAKWSDSGSGVILTDYYKDASGLEQMALKNALRRIVSKTTCTMSYDMLKTKLPYTDQDPNDSSKIMLFYTQESVSNKWDGGTTWNREHVWPQSKGWFKTSGAGADIQHLRPEDSRVNSTRGNLSFGEISGGTNVLFGSKIVGKRNSNYFEPLDEVKGDVARILMYLLVRYDSSDSYSITNVAQSMEMLLEWNELDPVSDFEKVRNERSYSIQGNRNPFIDHPELANLIW